MSWEWVSGIHFTSVVLFSSLTIKYYILSTRDVPIRFYLPRSRSESFKMSKCWYWVPFWCLASTNIFLDNTAALRKNKYLRLSCSIIFSFLILLEQSIYFHMALSYSACNINNKSNQNERSIYDWALAAHVHRGCGTVGGRAHRCLHVHTFTERGLNGCNHTACVHFVALETTHQLYVIL